MQSPNDNATGVAGRCRQHTRQSLWRKRTVFGMALVLLVGLGGWRINDWGHRQKLGPLLIEAIKHSDQAAVQRLLDQGADPNTRDNPADSQSSIWKRFQDWLHGRFPHAPTALMVAIKQDKFGPYYALIETLLRNGADADALDDRGCTPLMWAVFLDNPTLIQLLTAQGAKLEARDNEGCTALIHALRQNRHVSLIRLLLDRGADVNAADKKGKTALMEAAEHYANIPDAPDRARLLEAMLSRKVDVHKKDAGGFTTLMAFAGAGDATTTRRLLALGAEINARDNKGKTALMYALRGGITRQQRFYWNRAQIFVFEIGRERQS